MNSTSTGSSGTNAVQVGPKSPEWYRKMAGLGLSTASRLKTRRAVQEAITDFHGGAMICTHWLSTAQRPRPFRSTNESVTPSVWFTTDVRGFDDVKGPGCLCSQGASCRKAHEMPETLLKAQAYKVCFEGTLTNHMLGDFCFSDIDEHYDEEGFRKDLPSNIKKDIMTAPAYEHLSNAWLESSNYKPGTSTFKLSPPPRCTLIGKEGSA